MMAFVVTLTLLQAPRLAAPAWSSVEVSPDKAQFFALRLASALRGRGLNVITAQDITAVLGVERQKQLLGCSEAESSCVLELSNALGAELLLTGVIARLESSYEVNLRVLSSVDGRVVAQELVRAGTQEALLLALDDAAASLSRQLEPPLRRRALAPSPGFPRSRRQRWAPREASSMASRWSGRRPSMTGSCRA